MDTVRSFQDLKVWKRSVELTESIYRISVQWPNEEKFGLTQQVRRASVSIAANIAEGAERHGPREFLHFLSIAKGSLAEVRTFLIVAKRLGYLDNEHAETLTKDTEEISRMLAGLTKSLRNQNNDRPLKTSH